MVRKFFLTEREPQVGTIDPSLSTFVPQHSVFEHQVSTFEPWVDTYEPQDSIFEVLLTLIVMNGQFEPQVTCGLDELT